MNILIVSMEEFRNLFTSQVDMADLIIVDHKEKGFVYKDKYNPKQQYFETWEQIVKLVANTLSRKHVIYLPNL